jgi:hypothetical protein
MQHLNDEELARLVDEGPTDAEAAHLALCGYCAAELDALRLQTRTLAALPDLPAPPALQARLQAGLAVEGLLLGDRARQRSLLRIAASLALFAAGGLGGYLLRGAAAPTGPLAATAADPPATVTEAAERLQTAEAAYTAALAAYAQTAGSPPAADPVSRLAALEGIVLTTRAALDDAPADPVINGYHLTALEQRDAILRQIQDAPQEQDDNEQEWY